MPFTPIPNKVIEILFEEHRKQNFKGQRTRGTYSIEYVLINGKRFYYEGMWGSTEAAYRKAIDECPGREFVIWPRGGWGNPGLPALYVRNPRHDKAWAEEQKWNKEQAKKKAEKDAKEAKKT